ncbi:amidohydrolase family protein [Paenibacillus sp. HN-1]|uniref:amidohydrolase family protein n=1 Tax=Paenibacillus TaxID=44249 RepID=UPI001CA89E4E|nr:MULTISPECIES: amidohydrolase family protein [Paenibacillus]MBY9078330.1 amidohydrolase family protein [Paenibacillus sp. CGMCC 1.18879]MBY9086014.1 amidohydrolase family protein [Paenibacillus sinensis]
MRIDAHQHYWKIERGDYGWITPELPVLYRDFTPVDLEPLLNKQNFAGSVIVQAAPTIEETKYILSLADQASSTLGVVGWLDLFDPNHRKNYEEFQLNPKFKGFRIMIQDMPDASSILEPSFIEALQGYADEEVPVDLLLVSHQMEHVLELLKKVSNLRGVIDHIAKPLIKDKSLEPWLSYMGEFAKYPGIYCKISGMVTEADHHGWTKEEFKPYIRNVLELFGPERVIYGSDWPVCLLAAEYEEVVDILESALPETWNERERERLFGANAKEFYRL